MRRDASIRLKPSAQRIDSMIANAGGEGLTATATVRSTGLAGQDFYDLIFFAFSAIQQNKMAVASVNKIAVQIIHPK